MKCAVVFASGLKQIMLTPENEDEKFALSLITPDDDISLDIKHGTFFNSPPPSACAYLVGECKGEYLRAYENTESVMLVLRRKESSDD